MGLQMDEPVDDMRAGTLEPPRLPDVRGLVEPRFQLDERGDGLAAFGRFAKRIDDRAVVGRPVQGLLDRHDIRVGRGLPEEPDDHVEGLVGVVEKHVLLADRREDVAVVVLDALGHAGSELRPKKVRAVVEHQLSDGRRADHAVQLEHLRFVHAQLAHHQAAQVAGRASRNRQVDHAPAPTALQSGLEFADQILRLLLELQIAVAKDLERALLGDIVARKDAADLLKQQLFKRKEPDLPFGAVLEPHEPVDLLGDGQQGLKSPAVVATDQAQSEHEALVRNERERMRGINGKRRQHREDVLHEDVFQIRLVGLGEAGPVEKNDALLFELRLQLPPDVLLGDEELPRILFDFHQLLGGSESVVARPRAPGARELEQPRHAHGVELVQVGRGNRNEADALKERNQRILRLLQHPPIECQPRQLPVDEPLRAGPLGRGKLNRGRESAVQEIRVRNPFAAVLHVVLACPSPGACRRPKASFTIAIVIERPAASDKRSSSSARACAAS